jgi:hypothetical protein
LRVTYGRWWSWWSAIKSWSANALATLNDSQDMSELTKLERG